jgi:exonuclease III
MKDSLKIATFNICGWKSATQKGLLKWIEKEKIDILAIQELRTENITKPLISLAKDYSFYFNP